MGLDHGLRKDMPRPADILDWNVATDEEASAYFLAVGEWFDASEILTWRKENHIHAWFVKNVQGGVDECEDSLVTREQLGKFLDAAKAIIAGAELVPGPVYAGETMSAATGFEWKTNWDDGKVMTEASIELAKELMPRAEGFFFGSDGYDDRYMKSLTNAVEVLTPVYEQLNDKEVVIYWSSW